VQVAQHYSDNQGKEDDVGGAYDMIGRRKMWKESGHLEDLCVDGEKYENGCQRNSLLGHILHSSVLREAQ
jgi:hypothetical protein